MAAKEEIAQIRKSNGKGHRGHSQGTRNDPHRPCFDFNPRQHPGRLLRHSDADQPGRAARNAGPTLITVQPYDVSLVGPVEKAIRASDLGLNPSNDGRIDPHSDSTTHRRAAQKLAKHVHKVLEDHRTAVRNIRRDGNES